MPTKKEEAVKAPKKKAPAKKKAAVKPEVVEEETVLEESPETPKTEEAEEKPEEAEAEETIVPEAEADTSTDEEEEVVDDEEAVGEDEPGQPLITEVDEETFVSKYFDCLEGAPHRIVNAAIDWCRTKSAVEEWPVDTIARVSNAFSGFGITKGASPWRPARLSEAFLPLSIGVDALNGFSNWDGRQMRGFFCFLRDLTGHLMQAERLFYRGHARPLYQRGMSPIDEVVIVYNESWYRAYRETDPDEGGPCVILGRVGSDDNFVEARRIAGDVPAIVALADWFLEIWAASWATQRVISMGTSILKKGPHKGFTQFEDGEGLLLVRIGDNEDGEEMVEVFEDSGNGLLLEVISQINNEGFGTEQEVVRAYLAMKREAELRMPPPPRGDRRDEGRQPSERQREAAYRGGGQGGYYRDR
jgi:hypothetical protein